MRWNATIGIHRARRHSKLESPAAVGRRAAERTVRRLGARKVATQKVPVIFDSVTARSLVGNIFEAVEGDSIYRKASFLAGKLGERVASENVTVIDDGTMPGLFGTSPFDDEGVPSRRTVVIDRGVLQKLPAEHLHGAKAGAAHHRQRSSRGSPETRAWGTGISFCKRASARPRRSFAAFARACT